MRPVFPKWLWSLLTRFGIWRRERDTFAESDVGKSDATTKVQSSPPEPDSLHDGDQTHNKHPFNTSELPKQNISDTDSDSDTKVDQCDPTDSAATECSPHGSNSKEGIIKQGVSNDDTSNQSDSEPEGVDLESSGTEFSDTSSHSCSREHNESDIETETEENGNQVTKPPIDAPGRRTSRGSSNKPRKAVKPHRPKPELCCRRNPTESIWQVFVVAEQGLTSVSQQGNPLAIEGEECRVSIYDGSLEVTCEHSDVFTVSVFDDSNVAIFKLPANWLGEGRKVERLTRGFYIAIAPASYTQIGHVPHECEPCEDPQYAAYYLFVDASTKDINQLGFRECPLYLESRRFNLEGKSLTDQSEAGALFVKTPPVLEVDSSIEHARIGEERENGWRGQNFNPHVQSLAEVLDGRQGRFYLRVYDSSKLVDSGEFRYLKDLKEIRLDDEPFDGRQVIAPRDDGYEQSELSFVSEPGANMRLEFPRNSQGGEIIGNTVVVPPFEDLDHLEYIVSTNEGEVGVTIDLPRIWWQLESNEEWSSTQLQFSRKRYRELALSEACVSIRVPNFIRRVLVGINGGTDRSYRRDTGLDYIRIPLLDFVYYEEVADNLYEDAAIDVLISDTVVSVLKIEAEPLPRISRFRPDQYAIKDGEDTTLRWSTLNVHDNQIAIDPDIGEVEPNGNVRVSPRSTTTYTLRLHLTGSNELTANTTVKVQSDLHSEVPIAFVKRRRLGWRRGKGFSCLELEYAGLEVSAIRSATLVPVDQRRRTMHARNIRTLKERFDVS